VERWPRSSGLRCVGNIREAEAEEAVDVRSHDVVALAASNFFEADLGGLGLAPKGAGLFGPIAALMPQPSRFRIRARCKPSASHSKSASRRLGGRR